MATPAIALTDATPAHFEAIVRIERASGEGSIVALTEGHALQEALDRGHWVVVATDGADVVGWIWFSIELKSGVSVGQLFRVAVAPDRRREGVGAALVQHARAVLADCQCVRVRLTVDGSDDEARAFFERSGFSAAAVSMERQL